MATLQWVPHNLDKHPQLLTSLDGKKQENIIWDMYGHVEPCLKTRRNYQFYQLVNGEFLNQFLRSKGLHIQAHDHRLQ